MSTIKLDHVPLLESAINFPEWKRFITQVLQAEGYWPHIEGTDGLYNIFSKSLEPTACTAASKAEERTAFKEWWKKDMKARAIVLCRISPVTHSHLDTAVEKTARSIWENLLSLYERTDILSQFDLRDRLSNAKLRDYQDLDRYLGEFKDARLCFIAMSVTYTEFEIVHHIIRGIPDSGAWGHFRQLMTQTMQDHVEREKRTTKKCEPDTLLNQITVRLTIECQRLESESRSRVRPRQSPGSEYVNFSRDDGPIQKHTHNQGTRARAAASAALLNTLKDDAELSCASVEVAPDDLAKLVVNSWSTLLDSGATSHLIKSRDYFWVYNEEEARNVKTGNLGVLQTRANGTCVVRLTYNGVSTKVTLRNCLHAPHAFVNLLSVGRFVTANVSCTFEKDRVLLSKAGRPFGYGPMVNKLLLLEVEFLKLPTGTSHLDEQSSPSRSPPVSPAVAPSTPPSSRLWVEPSTQKPMWTWSQDSSRTRKLTEAEKTNLAKVGEAAARRGGMGGNTSDAGNVGNTQESDAGGKEDENPFVAPPGDHLQRDIDSLCGASLLSIRSDVRRNLYADGYDMCIPTATWTSTLPNGVTPLEIFYGRKPEVAKSRECYFMGYPPGERGYCSESNISAALELLDTAPTLQPPHLDTESSHSPESSPAPVFTTPRSSHLQIAPSTPKAVRTRSREKIREAAARRGGDNGTGGSDAGGEGDDNPFVASVCNNGVLDECAARTDSAVMAASLDANDYLQRHIDSFMKRLPMCPTSVPPNLPTLLIFWVPSAPNPVRTRPRDPSEGCKFIEKGRVFAYQRLICLLPFIRLCSRLDISFAILLLSQFCSAPLSRHYLVPRALRHLKGTKSYRLHYGSASPGRASISGFVWSYVSSRRLRRQNKTFNS